MFKKLFKSISDYFLKDKLQEKWDSRGVKLNRVVFEFENGTCRELNGDDAEEWRKDIYFGLNGRKIVWTRHKFIETKK